MAFEFYDLSDLTRDGVYKWRLDKTRHLLQWNGYHLELDVYHGAFTELVIAELEFESTEESKRLSPPLYMRRNHLAIFTRWQQPHAHAL